MRERARVIATAVGVLGLLCCSAAARAQAPLATQPVGRVASFASGTIHGLVQDESGAPVVGAMVSALGVTTAFAVTDRTGRFELRTLSPGPYLIRAHLGGFVAPRGQIVQVLPGTRVSSSIALRRISTQPSASIPLVPAAIGSGFSPPAPSSTEPESVGTGGETSDEGRAETAWRLRHARRSILNDATGVYGALIADDSPAAFGGAFGAQGLFGRAVGSPARVAGSFFADTPFFGQLNLLTSGSFDAPLDLFKTHSFERKIAYLSVGAPVGEHADWTVHAAVTQGDISSWIVSGDYKTRAPARHRYDVGLSYSTQRYEGGNPAALRNVTDGSRNAGSLHGFDTFTITPAVSLTYGAQYARYDYLDGQSLLSPRVALTVVPADHFRINTLVSHRALAPGAEEFQPPPDTAVWLPPQRTFSSLVDGRPLIAERTTHVEAELERDIAAGTTVSVRAFRQRVDGQLVTMFGVDVPGRPAASLGHYFVASDGGVDTSGYGAGIRTVIAERVHGSLEYSLVRATWNSTNDLAYMMHFAPSAVRLAHERVHDVGASIETDVPETSTRVLVLYRVSNGFARRDAGDRPTLDSRFDVQVRQSLPFMDFNSARWEMLVAVRDFFREAAAGQSIYDELLVVRPPKRVVGGLTLRF